MALTQKFHVVKDNFCIPVDGIIGRDFLQYYRCLIDYDEMKLTINYNDRQAFIPIQKGPYQDNLILPPRCESIYKITIPDNIKNDSYVSDNIEIKEGIYSARCIFNKEQPYIRIINTTNNYQTISKNFPQITPLNEFKIVKVEEAGSTEERCRKLINILKEKWPTAHHDDMKELCKEFNDIFTIEGDSPSVNNFYTQKIKIKDHSKSSYIKNYRLPHSQKQIINEKLETLLKNKQIEPSVSEYNSPIILVPKKSIDGKKNYRLCIDYRAVNKLLIPDRFPLPRIDEILDNLGRAKYFSVVDLSAGFHQIPIEKDSRPITSFSTDSASYQWTVLPFGLNISPNSFSRMMSIAFSGLPLSTAFLYMDDVIIPGKNERDHIQNLRKVFLTIRRSNLKLNPEKCQFFRKEVVYLGHRCTDQGIFPDNTKLSAIHNYPKPRSGDETKRFVAFANYYRRFIPNFSEIAQPLNKLTRKNTKFVWTKDTENSFQILKQKLAEPPILSYPDFKLPFIVTVDASQIACGAVLSQILNGEDRAICYASKTFTQGEKNKSTIERELIAIHWAVKNFRPYLYGTNFIINSDHKPLTYLFALKEPSSRLTRIRLDLEEYNFTINHIKGKDNCVADALSRISIDELKTLSMTNIRAITRSASRKKENEKPNTIAVHQDI